MPRQSARPTASLGVSSDFRAGPRPQELQRQRVVLAEAGDAFLSRLVALLPRYVAHPCLLTAISICARENTPAR